MNDTIQQNEENEETVIFSEETERKYELITRNLQEIMGKTELKKILETRNPVVYWGTAPTGRIHLGYIFQAIKIKDLVDAGCDVTILLADLHAFLDNSKSSLESVNLKTEYYKKIMSVLLETLNVNLEKIKFVKGSSFQTQPSYTLDMYKIASITNTTNCQHAGAEVVKQNKSPLMTCLLYPILQALDMPYLNADVFLGGVDQRKINAFGKDYLPKIGYTKKYIYLMTPLISGLSTKKSENKQDLNVVNIVNKMSSSDTNSKIDLLAKPNEIAKIVNKTYCDDGNVVDNSVLKLIETLVFKITNTFSVPKWDNNTKSLTSGKIYRSFDELKSDVELGSKNGGIHPADLKQGLSMFLINFLKPIRDYFEIEENKKLLLSAYGEIN